MDWWNHPDWLAMCRGIVAEPADDTRRLVAADWLQENYSNTPSAERRVHIIRYGIENGSRYPVDNILTTESVSLWEGMGFPETELKRLDSFHVVRGFPELVRFDPWRFNVNTVAPVFKLFPVKTCSFTIVHPEQARSLTIPTRVVWDWDDGPEDEDGLIEDITDLNHGINGSVSGAARSSTRQGLIETSASGTNPHEQFYRTELVALPGPVYYWLPVMHYTGEKRRLAGCVIPHTRFDTLRQACAAAMKAAWRCGRKWAKLSTRTAPTPNDYEVSAMVLRAESTYRDLNEDFGPEPYPVDVRLTDEGGHDRDVADPDSFPNMTDLIRDANGGESGHG